MTPAAATILIVDDEILNRKLLEALLQPEGYATVSVASGEEALALIAQRPPDLILLDIRMPGMDGFQVTTLLKANPATAHIPVILVTAQVDRAARVIGLDAGAEEFLTKPVDRAELWLRVRNLLRLKAASNLMENPEARPETQARVAGLQSFRTAMDSAADAIVLISRSTMRYVDVNATACNMLGYSRDELLRADAAQPSGVTSAEWQALYSAIIADHASNRLVETELQRKDGSALRVEGHWQAQRADADWIMVGVLRDLSLREAAGTANG